MSRARRTGSSAERHGWGGGTDEGGGTGGVPGFGHSRGWARGACRSGVLRLALAEGPVLLLHLDEVDEDVLSPEPQALVEPVRDCPVEGLLHLGGAPLVEEDLDDDAILRALDAQ